MSMNAPPRDHTTRPSKPAAAAASRARCCRSRYSSGGIAAQGSEAAVDETEVSVIPDLPKRFVATNATASAHQLQTRSGTGGTKRLAPRKRLRQQTRSTCARAAPTAQPRVDLLIQSAVLGCHVFRSA